MSRLHRFGCVLVPLSLLLAVRPAGAGEESACATYRTSAEAGAWLRRLAARLEAGGHPATLIRYGESTGGRPLEALRIGSASPVVLVQGGLGRRDAAGTVAVLAVGEAVAALETKPDVALLLVPAPNPDALDAFLEGRWPHGGRDLDRDRDGRSGEDGPRDLDGDGEILRMRRRAATGAFVAAPAVPGWDGPARGLRDAPQGEIEAPRFEVLDEALDADGDGRVGEDPPGVDLLRDLAGWWDDRAPWRGDGPFPGCAAESRALMELSFAETGLLLWIGFESAGAHVLFASEQGKTWELDKALHQAVAGAVGSAVERPVRRAGEALGRLHNPGSALDWAAVHLGVPACRIPVWWVEKQEGYDAEREVADETDWLLWNDRELGGEGFAAWRPFEHPDLGAIEIGGWRPYTRYEPPPALLPALAARAAKGVLAALGFRPVLRALIEVHARGGDLYEIQARAHNGGRAPTDSVAAGKQHRERSVRAVFVPTPGVELLAGPAVAELGRIVPGEASGAVRWLVRSGGGGRLGVVEFHHPRARPLRAAAEAR